jgi:1,4-dihydroxy-2-naphthoate octaprenyltransferase
MTLPEPPSSPPPQAWRLWWSISRPRTWPAAMAPVLVGTVAAARVGAWEAKAAALALVGAWLLQVASNIANDRFDGTKGADGPQRLGPPRATSLGWVSPRAMDLALGLVLTLALVAGSALAWLAGPWVVGMGLLAMVGAVAYTGGPFPLAYLGLGEVAAFLFFGQMAVAGSAFVQSGRWLPEAFLMAVPIGAMAAAILLVNNLRDEANDRAAGKGTLVVRLGSDFGRGLYVALLGVGFLGPVALAWGGLGWGGLLPLLALPLAKPLVEVVLLAPPGPRHNEALAGTAQLGLAIATLLALGAWPW